MKRNRIRTYRHGVSRHPLYSSWYDMIQRCHNPKNHDFKNYGARGIAVHWRFHIPQVFFDAMGPKPSPRHSIGRKDNNRGYEPGNVRWETPEEQNGNRRNNKIISFRGETLIASEMVRRHSPVGITPVHFFSRLRSGWDVEKALLTPLQDRFKNLDSYIKTNE